MGDAEQSEKFHSTELNGTLYTKAALFSLRQTLASTMTQSWMYESLVVTALDSALPPPPVTQTEPNCGVHAFTALFPRVTAGALQVFEDVAAKGWMNRRSMEAALKKVGSDYRVLQRQLPQTGLALIEWTGTWPREDFWGSDLKYTHWVAVAEGFIYDINWSGWLPRQMWEDVVLNDLIASLPQATGWRPHTGYQLV